MSDRIDRVVKMIVNLLRVLPAAGDPGFPPPSGLTEDLATVFKVRLGPRERLFLATASMMSLGHAPAERLAEETLLAVQRGAPLPPFTTLREEARDWVALASLAELRAYLSACWNRLPRAEQGEFLDAVGASRREPA